MKSKIIKNDGYHPANIPLADNCQKQDEAPPFGERIVVGNKIILYDKDEKPLVRKIGFK